MLTTSEKIRILLKRKGMTAGDLAVATNQTRQNLSNKMQRDNFTEKELYIIAKALGCVCSIKFITEDGEEF